MSSEVALSGPEAKPEVKANYVAFIALVTGAFLSILDIQIVASALGPMSASLSATIDEIAWVQTSYLIAEVIVIPLSGWLLSALGTRLLFGLAAGGFTIMSLACAVAWSLPMMVTFRALQGLFGGLLIPIVFTAIYQIFPPGKQGMATVIASLGVSIAPILGPIVGGYLTHQISWHWMFLINIPIGVAAVLAGLATIDHDKPNFPLLRQADVVGILLIAVCLGTLEFTLKEGQEFDWFDSTMIRITAATALISAIWFYVHERRHPHPVVVLDLFRNRNFALGCVLSFLYGVAFFAPNYLIPALLTTVRGFDSLQIGLALIPMGIFMMVSGLLAGALEKRIPSRLMAIMGFSIAAVGLYVDADMTADVGQGDLFLGQALRGLSGMLVFLPCAALSMGSVSPAMTGQASSLFNLTRNLGGAIGLALITWLVETRTDSHAYRLREAMGAPRIAYEPYLGDTAVFGAPMADLPAQTTTADALRMTAEQLVLQQAHVLAYADAWRALAVTLAIAILILLFVKGVSPAGTPAPSPTH